MFAMLARLWRTLDKVIGLGEKLADIAHDEIDKSRELSSLTHNKEVKEAKALLAASKK